MITSPLKNVVFVDWQNMYHNLWLQFKVKPYQVNVLTLLKERVLDAGIVNPEFRFYTGIPDVNTDPVGHDSSQKFVDWLEHNGAKIWTRTLRSHIDEEGKLRRTEKGADVRLGCELVAMAVSGQLANAIIVSADQDLSESVSVAKMMTRSLKMPDVQYHTIKMGELSRGINGTNWLALTQDAVLDSQVKRVEELVARKPRVESER